MVYFKNDFAEKCLGIECISSSKIAPLYASLTPPYLYFCHNYNPLHYYVRAFFMYWL